MLSKDYGFFVATDPDHPARPVVHVWANDESEARSEFLRIYGWEVVEVRRRRDGETSTTGDGFAYREFRARVWEGEGRPPIGTMPGGRFVRCMAWSYDEARESFERDYGHLGVVYELYNVADSRTRR